MLEVIRKKVREIVEKDPCLVDDVLKFNSIDSYNELSDLCKKDYIEKALETDYHDMILYTMLKELRKRNANNMNSNYYNRLIDLVANSSCLTVNDIIECLFESSKIDLIIDKFNEA